MQPNNIDSWANVTFDKKVPVTYYIRVYTDEDRIVKTSTVYTYDSEDAFKMALKQYVPQSEIRL